jgi:uncharacterized protein (DUF488 family)
MPRSVTVTPIFTVGYGSRSLDDVLQLMIRESIAYVVDVRSVPVSRFSPQFSKEPLSEALKSVDIQYVFMGDTLGGRPKDQSCYLAGHVMYDLVRRRDYFRVGLNRLLKATSNNLRICLLCSENRPEDCHRAKLIGVSLEAEGVRVIHIDANGDKVSQSVVIARLENPQTEMFGTALQSRKAYSPRIGHIQHQKTTSK